MGSSQDFFPMGTVLNLQGAAILTTYVTGTVENTGKPNKLRHTIKTITKAGTAMTSIVAKLQASNDGVLYQDVLSYRDSTGAAQIEHTLTLADNNTPGEVFSIVSDGTFEFCRLAVKVNGGAGAAGDSVTAEAEGSESDMVPSTGGGGGGGDATAANQVTGNASLASIDGKTPALVGGRQPVDGSGVTQPISAASLPLPTGAASAANQTTEIGHLATLSSRATPGTTSTHASVAASASSVTLQAANAARKGLYLRNTDAAPMYFRFGAGPALLSDPLYLLQEQVYEMPKDLSTAIVVGIWLAATGGTCEVEEIT